LDLTHVDLLIILAFEQEGDYGLTVE
jgi:hypothetical protein